VVYFIPLIYISIYLFNVCRSYKNAKWPYFWRNIGPQGLHQFELRLLYDVVPMQWDWPVVVNFHEADAFANWRASRTGKRIRVMSEIEHNAIRDNTASSSGRDIAQSYSQSKSMANAVSNCF